MLSICGKIGLRSVFLLVVLALQWNSCYCFKLFWWGSEPEKVSTEPEYGECDWANPAAAQFQVQPGNGAYRYNNAGNGYAIQNAGAGNAYGSQNTGAGNGYESQYAGAGNGYAIQNAGNGYGVQNPGAVGNGYGVQNAGPGYGGATGGYVSSQSQIPNGNGGSLLYYNQDDLVASHPTLPIGSYASVTNPNNEKYVVVRIIEQNPAVVGRIATLSSAAFQQIADLDQAVIPCYVATT